MIRTYPSVFEENQHVKTSKESSIILVHKGTRNVKGLIGQRSMSIFQNSIIPYKFIFTKSNTTLNSFSLIKKIMGRTVQLHTSYLSTLYLPFQHKVSEIFLVDRIFKVYFCFLFSQFIHLLNKFLIFLLKIV